MFLLLKLLAPGGDHRDSRDDRDDSDNVCNVCHCWQAMCWLRAALAPQGCGRCGHRARAGRCHRHWGSPPPGLGDGLCCACRRALLLLEAWAVACRRQALTHLKTVSLPEVPSGKLRHVQPLFLSAKTQFLCPGCGTQGSLWQCGEEDSGWPWGRRAEVKGEIDNAGATPAALACTPATAQDARGAPTLGTGQVKSCSEGPQKAGLWPQALGSDPIVSLKDIGPPGLGPRDPETSSVCPHWCVALESIRGPRASLWGGACSGNGGAGAEVSPAPGHFPEWFLPKGLTLIVHSDTQQSWAIPSCFVPGTRAGGLD